MTEFSDSINNIKFKDVATIPTWPAYCGYKYSNGDPVWFSKQDKIIKLLRHWPCNEGDYLAGEVISIEQIESMIEGGEITATYNGVMS